MFEQDQDEDVVRPVVEVAQLPRAQLCSVSEPRLEQRGHLIVLSSARPNRVRAKDSLASRCRPYSAAEVELRGRQEQNISSMMTLSSSSSL